MKKTVTSLMAMAIAIAMMFSLSACGTNAKKQEAIDAFNSTKTVFNEAANLINDNPDMFDDDTISTFQEMSALLTQYKELLDGDTEISDEKYDEMITWFSTTKSW